MQSQILIADLQSQLNDFDPAKRQQALHELIRLAEQGAVVLPAAEDVANMHCHTFFSFNAYGYSPSALAWLGRERGYKLMGIVDFDVLDAVGEFLDACDLVGLAGSAGIESRLFVPEFADREINSPGEPGVTYHMGIGLTSSVVPAEVAPIAASLRQAAAARNIDVVARVNAYLDPVTIDYAADVLPLTPNGNATERHIVEAYVTAAERLTPNPTTLWAGKLGMSPDQVAGLMQDGATFKNTVRARLMKRGGVGYVQPDAGSFPRVEAFHELVVACGALPCVAWLDGASAGEQAMPELLELLVRKGVAAMNIIPDRNWNIANPEQRQNKVKKLYEVVDLARAYDLPINIGTEMNAFGQKLMDDFDSPELAPVRQAFLDGAHFIYGHTLLQRVAGLGYQSDWAKAHLPTRAERNAFFTQVGYVALPGVRAAERLPRLSSAMNPAAVLKNLT